MPRQLILLLSSPPPHLPPFLLFSFSFYFTPLWCFMDAPSDQRAKVICSARRRECGESGDNVTNQRGEQLTSNCITKRVGCIICLAFFFHGGIKNQLIRTASLWHRRRAAGEVRVCVLQIIAPAPDYEDYNSDALRRRCDWTLTHALAGAKRQVECWTWTFSCCRNSVTTNQ